MAPSIALHNAHYSVHAGVVNLPGGTANGTTIGITDRVEVGTVVLRRRP
jgi:hypothetical protein